MILSVSNVAKSFDAKEVLQSVSFHLEEKQKAALIGVNGAGKTTLLRLLLGQITPDSGQIYLAKGTRVGYLPQNPAYESGNRIEEELLAVFENLRAMEREMRSLEEAMQKDHSPKVMARYDSLQRAYEEQNGYQYRSQVRGVLSGLGFAPEEYDLPINVLSGGQKTRVMLARLLLQKPDLLMLDEPTNHLDIESLTWLEGYLQDFPGAALIISHDRYFLDKLCTRTIEIERGVSQVYEGNYTYYIHEKEERQKTAMRAYDAQQKEIRRQQEIIKTLRSFNREKSIKRAQSREKILDKMERIDKPAVLDDTMKLSFRPSVESADLVLKAQELGKSFGSRALFEHLDFEIHKGEKIALIGPNGVGKTTLFKMIMGQEAPTRGDLYLGVKVVPGYYDQAQENLHPEKTVLGEIYDTYYPALNEAQVRQILGRFLFRGDDVFKRISELSGGEKARVSLCKIMLSSCNFLLLDEPTNHLDMTSREVLEDTLGSYEGTLFFISHDRYFINKVATKTFELTPGSMNVYLGNYDFYLTHQKALASQDLPDEKSARSAGPGNAASRARGIVSANAPDTRRSALGGARQKEEKPDGKQEYEKRKQAASDLRKLKSRADHLEKEIDEIEQKIGLIQQQMLDPKFYSSASAFHELETQQKALEAQQDQDMEEWDALQEQISHFPG